MSEIYKIAKNYVRTNYGNLATIDEPKKDENNKRWIVNVKSNYPRIIQDDINNERYVKILTLNKLCQLHINYNGRVIQAPPKRECLTSLNSALNLWKERIERYVTKASSIELSNVRTVQHFLRPMEVIINYITHFDVFTYYDIEELTRTQRYMDWIELLLSLDIIESTSEGYTYGNTWTGYIEKYPNENNLLERFYSLVLSERYSYMTEILNIGNLGTVIHSNSCYYKSCIEADKIINKHSKSIWKDYVKHYGYKSYPEVFNTLLELAEGKVIEFNKPYFSGNEVIFDRLLDYQIDTSIMPPI